jgi:hypothetical protein
MNVHTPQRGENESREEYAERRLFSHQLNAMNGRPENWTPKTRTWGSFVTSPPLNTLLYGIPLPKLVKRKSRKIRPDAAA